MLSEKEKIINQLKRLKQYSNISEEELEKIAQQKIDDVELRKSFSGLLDSEVDRAMELYNRYLKESSFENLAEKTTLKNIVYLEILKERIQELLKKDSEEHNGAVNLRETQSILELDEKILQFKKDSKLLDVSDDTSVFNKWEELEKKCLKYYEENAAEFYNKCPYCNKIFPCILPPDQLISEKSSWFKETDLYNKEVFDLYHKKIINEETSAKILGVSKQYILLMYKEIYLKELEKNDNKTN